MPPQARVPPANHPVFIWPTPEQQDLLFYVERDGTLPKYDTWDYGDVYSDVVAYPNHKLVHVSPQDGNGWSRWYYAADRISQDAYNWEYQQADLGGRKFDGVRRTYLTPRADFSSSAPAAGAAMPDTPTGLFTGYILATREQRRTGDEIFDSVYVIEIRDYINRVASSASSYDQTTEGVLIRTETLYYRGELYGGTAIETAILDETKWGVSAGGVQTEAVQLSEDWFMVTSTDVVPQNKTTGSSKFGGLLLRSYDTYITYSWPAVLGDDESLLSNGVDLVSTVSEGIEIMDWEYKDGGSRDIPRPMFEEQAYRGPTRATITEEWSKTAPTIAGQTNRPYQLRPLPIVYNSPYLTLGIPPSLHDAVTIKCDTGTNDPTWGLNTGSQRTFPATNQIVWPPSFTASVEVTPFRGGYMTRHVLVYKPEEIPA